MNYVGSGQPVTPRNNPRNFYLSVDNNNKMKQQAAQEALKVPEVLSTFDFNEENNNTKKYR